MWQVIFALYRLLDLFSSAKMLAFFCVCVHMTASSRRIVFHSYKWFYCSTDLLTYRTFNRLKLCNIFLEYYLFKHEAQAALFKGTVRTVL